MAPPCDTTELAVIQLACKIKQIDICPHRFNFMEENRYLPTTFATSIRFATTLKAEFARRTDAAGDA